MNLPINHGDLTAAGSSKDRQKRRPVQLRGLVFVDDRKSVDVTVLDLTYDGCCVETAGELALGQSIKLSVSGLGLIEAQVRWCKDGRSGLVFLPDDFQDGKELTPRVAQRLLVDAEVMQRRHGQPNYRVRVFDVSRHGCKAEFVERPRVGDRVWLKFEGLESLDTEVCWAEGHKVGLQFANPIHPAVFELLAKRFATAA